MGVAIKDREKTALEETVSETHAAVCLQKPCSCRCFGSRTSMFSIHCKVLRVGRQKTEGMLVQNRRGRTSVGRGIHHRNPLPSALNSPLKFRRRNHRMRAERWGSVTLSGLGSRWTAGARGREGLTLHHVAAGRLLKEIFKDPHYQA